MRNVFGWSLPPGCSNRDIDEAAGVDQPCAVCIMDVADCCCPECPTCGSQGDPACYEISDSLNAIDKGHGLKLNKEQVIAREEAYIRSIQQRHLEEQMVLDQIKASDQTEWYFDEAIDPWG